MKPHAQNAPGDFYVEEGCCITCGIPVELAPTVFDWADEPYPSHCIVKRQPGSDEEVTQTLEALLDGEVSCIRYRGRDADVARRIVEMGMAECCDGETPSDAVVIIRDRVSFAATMGPHEAARRYRAYLQARSDERQLNPFAFDDAGLANGGNEVRHAWFEDTFHTVSFEGGEDPGRVIAIARPNPRVEGARGGLARDVGRWLTCEPAADDLRWYAEWQWLAGGPWSTSPI